MTDIACGQSSPQKIPGVGEVTIRVPCADPQPDCPKPPSGPGTGHIGNIPGTNVEIHVNTQPEASKCVFPDPLPPEPVIPPTSEQLSWSETFVLMGGGVYIYMAYKAITAPVLLSNPVTAPFYFTH